MAAKVGPVTLTRIQAATLIQALLSAKPPEDAPPVDNLPSDLAETAWIEADDALARALQQTPALREAIRRSTELGPRLRSQLGTIIQAVRASAAKRELEIEGDPGSEAAFDPGKHAQEPAQRVLNLVKSPTATINPPSDRSCHGEDGRTLLLSQMIKRPDSPLTCFEG